MKVEYDLTKKDYIDFNLHHLINSPVLKKFLFIQRYMLPLIFLILPLALGKVSDIPLWYWYCCFIIVFFAWVIFYPMWQKKLIVKRIEKLLDEGKSEALLGHHSFIVDEEGFTDKTMYGENRYYHAERVTESNKHIFIYISPVSAFIIPVKFFADKAEKEALVTMLRRFC